MIENIEQFKLNKEKYLQKKRPDIEVKKAIEYFVDCFQEVNEFTLKLPFKKPSVRFIINLKRNEYKMKRL